MPSKALSAVLRRLPASTPGSPRPMPPSASLMAGGMAPRPGLPAGRTQGICQASLSRHFLHSFASDFARHALQGISCGPSPLPTSTLGSPVPCRSRQASPMAGRHGSQSSGLPGTTGTPVPDGPKEFARHASRDFLHSFASDIARHALRGTSCIPSRSAKHCYIAVLHLDPPPHVDGLQARLARHFLHSSMVALGIAI